MLQKTHEEKIKKLEDQMIKDCEQKEEKGEAKFCPKCGSFEIGIEAESLIPRDYCKACGFNSIKKGLVEAVNFPTKIKGEEE